MRAVITAAGIQNILTKSLGSTTAHNVVKATVDALMRLKQPERVARLRGKQMSDILAAEQTRRRASAGERLEPAPARRAPRGAGGRPPADAAARQRRRRRQGEERRMAKKRRPAPPRRPARSRSSRSAA